MKIELWVAIVIAAIGIIPGVLALVSQFLRDKRNKKQLDAEVKKLDAEVADLLTEAASSLIAPLTERVHDLECKVRTQDRLIKSLVRIQRELCYGIRMLIDQLTALGHTPVFVLDEGYCKDVDALTEEILSQSFGEASK